MSAATIPTSFPRQTIMENAVGGIIISDALNGIADTCNLTDDLTYASEYAVAHGGFSDVYLGDLVVKHTGTKGVAVEVCVSAFLIS